MGKTYSNGLSLFISEIFGTVFLWLYLVLLSLPKRLFDNKRG